MILLAVDPSLRSTGAALFSDGRLIGVARLRGLDPGADITHRCRAMARDVDAWVELQLTMAQPQVIALEWPQIYRAAKSKGDHNDLLGLAGVCAAVAALYPSAEVRSYLPADWEPAPKVSPARKARGLGPIDSEAFSSPRGVRIMSRLAEAERALVPQSHDAVDAVGIGLHHLGRLAPRRVYHGAVQT
jgi:hypothetical protein